MTMLCFHAIFALVLAIVYFGLPQALGIHERSNLYSAGLMIVAKTCLLFCFILPQILHDLWRRAGEINMDAFLNEPIQIKVSTVLYVKDDEKQQEREIAKGNMVIRRY